MALPAAHATHAAHHAHDHAYAPHQFGRIFAFAVTINAIYVTIEAIVGWQINSVALLADVGHNLSDIMGMMIAWGAYWLAQRKPSARFTYGYSNASIYAALLNAMILLVAVGMMCWEAIERFQNPQPVPGGVVMLVAGIGLVLNGFTAWLFARGHHDVNMRGAYLHMLADAAVSGGVVVAGGLMLFTGWLWLDPLTSLLIAVAIVWATAGLLKDTLHLSMNGVPRGIDPEAVQKVLVAQPGVRHVHDLHIWPLSSSNTALTCHLVMPGGHPGDAFLLQLAERMAADFGIGHVTFQVEISEEAACGLDAPCDGLPHA